MLRYSLAIASLFGFGSIGISYPVLVYDDDLTSLAHLKNVLYKIGANPITFDDIPKPGSPTIIEILEDCIPKSDAVIALLTPDDEGRKLGDNALELRARQNVLV
jgi:predicted nucleotide-binding protein